MHEYEVLFLCSESFQRNTGMFEKNRSMQYSFFLRWTCTKQCLHPPVKVAVLGVDISVRVMLQAQDRSLTL